MPGDTVSDSEVQQFVALRQAHHSARQIAALTGRSLNTVCRYLKRERQTTGRVSAVDGLTQATVQALKVDYLKGYAMKYLEKAYGVPYRGLQQLLDACPPPSKHTTGIERLLDLQEAVLADYTTDAISLRDMARRFGTHEGTMRTFLAMHGVLKQRGGQAGEHNPQHKARGVEQKDRTSGKYWARRVVELALGRTLPKGWVIHHMNENPLDQSHSNLWLFPSPDAHSRYHQQLRDSLTQGGQLSSSRLALDNGGQWLPRMIDRQGSSLDIEPQSLCGRPL